MTTTYETGNQVGQTASTAADESRRVGQVAGEEMQNVAGEAKAQARHLADEARTQVEEQSRSQRDRLVSTLTTFSDDLDSMSREGAGGQGLAAEVVRMVSDRARDLGSRLDGREPRELLEDVRMFARRRPGTFLLGSLAAGVVAGRLLRGAKDAGDNVDSADSPGVQPAARPGAEYEPVQTDAPASTTGTIVDHPVPPTGGTIAPGGETSPAAPGGAEPAHRATP